MDILKFRTIYYIFSAILMLASVLLLLAWGLPLGIDFTGGSLLEIEFGQERTAKEEIASIFEKEGIPNAVIQATGERGYIIRFSPVNEKTHQNILTALEEKGSFTEKRFDLIGPVIGKELRKKAITSLLLVLAAILFYVAWAFRKARGFVSGWRYGFITLATLSHDVLITVGFFAAGGIFFHYTADIPFVAAILLVLGYSVTDTVVVFDRIRENILRKKEEEFYSIVSKSIRQTLVRSLNTSLTTLAVVLAIFFFGGETLKSFSATLAVGIAVGTYSSIFLASPLLYSSRFWKASSLITRARKRI